MLYSESGFILVNISVPFYFFRKKKERGAKAVFSYGVMPIIGMLICAFLWLNMSSTAKTVGLIWLGIGIIVLAIQTKGFRKLPPEMELE